MGEISEISINQLIVENKFLKNMVKDAQVTIHNNKLDEHGQEMLFCSYNDSYSTYISYLAPNKNIKS